jgi:hypothetical protein
MKPTKATLRQRVDEIYLIRLQGGGGVEIRQYVAEKEAAGEAPWTLPEGGKPLSERSIWRYIERADELIAESAREGRKRRYACHLMQRRHLYSMAVSQADVKAALACIRDLAELEGLYPPKKVAPTNPDGDKGYGELSETDRAAALAFLYARVGAAGGEPHPDGPADGGGSVLDRPGPDSEGRGPDPGPLAG